MASAVVFDVFGTLTGFESLREGQIKSVAEALGVPKETFSEALIATYDERARGKAGDIREQMLTLATRAGVHPTAESVDEAVRLRVEGQLAILQPRPGAIEVLTTLRGKGIKVGVLTDCTAETPQLWSKTVYAGLVDCAVFSCEVGARKPEKQMYDAVLSGLETRAEDALYVGDGGSSELSGAARAGLHPIWLKIEGENHFRYDREVDWRGESISDLAQVLELVDRPLDGWSDLES